MSDYCTSGRHALVLLLAGVLTVQQVWAHGGEEHDDEKKSTAAPVAVAAVSVVKAVNAQGQVTFVEPVSYTHLDVYKRQDATQSVSLLV